MSEPFIKNETLSQVFSCEFRENFNNTFFYISPLVATFEQLQEHILSRSNIFLWKLPLYLKVALF